MKKVGKRPAAKRKAALKTTIATGLSGAHNAAYK